MAKRTPPTHPQAKRQIKALGVRLRTARLRRGMAQDAMAERVGVSRQTISKIEAGDPSTSLATAIRVLAALGLSQDLDRLAAEDTLGHSLTDAKLTRAPARPRP